ncbi:unnamed protein product [Cyclocybe aegerita]|uniref:Nephrocystin 3-like N-terminal domain-containing protein n=1 Tax=Cyclocybe aegerita TaxID=1973307 RepID=A0A8S0W4S7_CYCAE|nr:unnamed protein product [Cyclocybe aegerita]
MANIFSGSQGVVVQNSSFHVNAAYQTSGSRAFETLGEIDTDAFILWLYGPAGAGKSAIARTDRSSTEYHEPVVASIAYRIALTIPPSRALIESVIDSDPLRLFNLGYFSQNPFLSLIIVDGLDECQDEDAQATFIRTLSSTIRRYSAPLKFLIVSRPEKRIRFAFNRITPPSIASHLELNNDFNPDDDIRHFLEDKFGEKLGSRTRSMSSFQLHGPAQSKWTPWLRRHPRLDIVLELRPPDRDLPFAELDNLYHHILSRVDDLPLVLKILEIRIALDVGALSPHLDIISHVLSLEDGALLVALSDLRSVLAFNDWEMLNRDGVLQIITFYHSSFADYLVNRQRSGAYCVDVRAGHTKILQTELRRFNVNSPLRTKSEDWKTLRGI